MPEAVRDKVYDRGKSQTPGAGGELSKMRFMNRIWILMAGVIGGTGAIVATSHADTAEPRWRSHVGDRAWRCSAGRTGPWVLMDKPRSFLGDGGT